jgi:hypothetical protein
MKTIAQLLTEQSADSEFCAAVNKVIELGAVTHFTGDDSADDLGLVLGSLLAELPQSMEEEVWASGEYVIYKFIGLTKFYRLCQRDMGGCYCSYFW